MLSSTILSVALYAGVTLAAIPTAASSCASGPASKYMQLSDFPTAQSYCSEHYPSPSTTTVTLCATPAPTGASKRDDNWQRQGNPGPSFSRPPPPPQGSSESGLLSQLLDQDDSTVSAFCSCIATAPDTVTVTARCSSNEYCESTSGTCQVQRDCKNPMRCDGHSYCGKGPAGNNLFCHQDTDNSDAGYCMNDGPADNGCPDHFEDCSSNSDCGGQRVCIYSCCREQPFCVDVRDYQSQNSAAASRLFRRGPNPRNGR